MTGAAPEPGAPRSLVSRACLRTALAVLAMALLLFGTSGDLGWGMAWAYVVFAALFSAGLLAYLALRNPELLAERMKGFKGTRAWDKFLIPVAAVAGPLAMLVVAGLDRRFGWSPEIPPAAEIAGFAAMVAGYAVVAWAMAENTFFSAAVRMQRERGQTVVSSGPYAHVRHPGYAGAILADLALPIALGSLCALGPAALAAVLLVVRTLGEDRMLRDELDGYAAYTVAVPCRLLPGVW